MSQEFSQSYQRGVEALRASADGLRAAGVALNELELERQRLQGVVDGFPGSTLPDPPTLPPIIVDPSAPDFSEFGFAHLIPPWTPYARPKLGDCDWVIDRPRLTAFSMRGLGEVPLDATAPGHAGDLLRRSIAAGHGEGPTRRVRFGVVGSAGDANLGGFYPESGGHSPADVCARDQAGNWIPQDVEFVGLTGDDEVAVTWGGSPAGQSFGSTERLACFGLGLVGKPSVHAFVQNYGAGELIFDDFWVLAPPGVPVGWHALFHIANWQRRLVLRGQRRKVRPGESPVTTTGHDPYLKGTGVAGALTYVLGCDLRGGNQTCMQYRPGTDEPYLSRPADTLIVADNVCDGYGWEHDGEGGGSALSLYAGHSRAFFMRNSAREVRYGAMLVSGQPLYTGQSAMGPVVNHDRNWYDEMGYPIGEVFIDGNHFSNPAGGRPCVELNNARKIFFGDKNVLGEKDALGNVIGSKLVIDSAWIHTQPPVMPRARVRFVGERSKFQLPYTYDPSIGAERLVSDAALDAMHKATWEEALNGA